MARCPNKNTAEYKALRSNFNNDVATINVINSWQDLNKSEMFPTVAEALEFDKSRKVFHSLKQREFSDAILGNLSRLKLGSKLGEKFYLNNSDRTTWDPDTWVYNEKILEDNHTLAKRYLAINNISESAVEFKRTEKSYEVIVNDNMFSPSDIVKASENRTTPHSRQLIIHLQRLFPEVNIKIMDVSQARSYYNRLDPSQKANVPFDKVRSFFVGTDAIIIKGRTSNETAIEEVLHPFVDSLLVDNPQLFESLLEEAKKNFPVLWQGIQDAYSNKRGFSERHRNLELVTQALSRHFNNEYETQPTQSFKSKIKQFLEWFADIIKDFSKYLTGRPLVIRASTLTQKTKLTDIAKLLNTSDIEFKMGRVADSKVRYSLTPEKQETLKYIIGQTVNSKQEDTVKRLFHLAESSEKEIDKLVAGVVNPTKEDSLVVLNEADHTYIDIVTGEQYTSATTVIKGGMTPSEQKAAQLNLDIGNE